jgi:hypothetical protein
MLTIRGSKTPCTSRCRGGAAHQVPLNGHSLPCVPCYLPAVYNDVLIQQLAPLEKAITSVRNDARESLEVGHSR